MATKYWVGGSGNWSDDDNHWATSSGGSPGDGNIPTSSDSIKIDTSSGTGTLTLDGNVTFVNFRAETDSGVALNTANYNITCSDFSYFADTGQTSDIVLGSTTLTTKNFDVGGGVVRVDFGTSTIILNPSFTADFRVATAQGTVYNLQSTSGTTVFVFESTVNNYTVSAGATVKFYQGRTFTFTGTVTMTGSAGNLITILSYSVGTKANISKSSGTVSCDYLSVTDSNATGGATWYAGTNSTLSNTTGWKYEAGNSPSNSPSLSPSSSPSPSSSVSPSSSSSPSSSNSPSNSPSLSPSSSNSQSLSPSSSNSPSYSPSSSISSSESPSLSPSSSESPSLSPSSSPSPSSSESPSLSPSSSPSEGAQAPNIVSSYDESNAVVGAIYGGETVEFGAYQSFTGDGGVLKSVTFYISKYINVPNPTGNVYAQIYAHSGVYGTSSERGSLLATSTGIDITTISTSIALVNFVFTGANKITLENGTNYCAAITYTGLDDNGGLNVKQDDTTPKHSGNAGKWYNTTKTILANADLIFYVYKDISSTSSSESPSLSPSSSESASNSPSLSPSSSLSPSASPSSSESFSLSPSSSASPSSSPSSSLSPSSSNSPSYSPSSSDSPSLSPSSSESASLSPSASISPSWEIPSVATASWSNVSDNSDTWSPSTASDTVWTE